eukprot:15463294-Alexandrium_andersonii.AAC.1
MDRVAAGAGKRRPRRGASAGRLRWCLEPLAGLLLGRPCTSRLHQGEVAGPSLRGATVPDEVAARRRQG